MWNKKWLVIVVTVIAALGSVVYALLAPQIYKAEALLLPPRAKDVISINVETVNEFNLSGIQKTQKREVTGVTVS